MTRIALLALFLACGCGSDSGAPSKSTGGEGGSCPDVTGTWYVTKHCDQSLVGMSAVVSESDCELSFAAPFNGFTGSVDADGTVTLSGPQSCTGKASGGTIPLACTPGTCAVELSRTK